MAKPAGTKSHLNTGDTIEYALTMQVEAHNTPIWVRMAGETTVRESESAQQAMNRLTGWIEGQLEAKIDDLI